MTEIEQLLKLSPPFLLIVALTYLGRTLKATPHVPDWTVPWILPLAGGILYTYLGPAFPLPWIAQVDSPQVVYGLIGFVCGSTAVGFHQAWKQFVTRDNEETKADEKE